jgi:hypothetical protein
VDLAARSVEVILAGQAGTGGTIRREALAREDGGPPPASPLLRSHAMYLRLHHALRDRR